MCIPAQINCRRLNIPAIARGRRSALNRVRLKPVRTAHRISMPYPTSFSCRRAVFGKVSPRWASKLCFSVMT